MKSLLYRSPAVVPFTESDDCKPQRTEVVKVIRKHGRLHRMVIRDKIVIEDPLLMLVRAYAFSVKNGTEYVGQDIPRSIRDFLLKSNVGVI